MGHRPPWRWGDPVAGAARPGGRPRVRPTSGRVRDALFNTLAARVGGSRVLDLFAGTGALGLEALARGAGRVLFVERDARLVEGIRERLAKEGWAAHAAVWRRDVLRAVRELGSRGEGFDLILLDPPYGEGWIPRTLRAVVAARLLAPGGVVVAEGHWRDRPPPSPGLVLVREARHGETALWFYTEEGAGG